MALSAAASPALRPSLSSVMVTPQPTQAKSWWAFIQAMVFLVLCSHWGQGMAINALEIMKLSIWGCYYANSDNLKLLQKSSFPRNRARCNFIVGLGFRSPNLGERVLLPLPEFPIPGKQRPAFIERGPRPVTTSTSAAWALHPVRAASDADPRYGPRVRPPMPPPAPPASRPRPRPLSGPQSLRHR